MKAIEQQLDLLADSLRAKMEGMQDKELMPKKWKMPKPRVCIMEPKRSKLTLGWYSPDRWKQGAVSLDEIVLTPASVSQGVFNAAEVVAHELVHLANAIAGRHDTSRQGRYHNEQFREMAEALGLKVEQDRSHGWCNTRLGEELTDHVRDLIQQGVLDPHVFKYQRSSASSKPSLVKISAACGVFAYVTRSQADAGSLQCSACGEILRPAKKSPD